MNVAKQLTVGDGHSLYVEESGNINGLPVLFLHGGPGAGSSPIARCFFDPGVYRIIVFDQRGCGRSTPYASLENNTTWDLIEDIEKIRTHFGIDKWVLFGGSWGSTLGLVYAQKYPQRVLGLILRGIFLCRPEDINWFYQKGASELYPDLWQRYISDIPEDERDDMLSAYHRRLTSSNESVQLKAAESWAIWEGSTASLQLRPEIVKHFQDKKIALSLARIECHYFVNNGFLEPNQILNNVDKLHSIPGVIVHGRHDVICPVIQAWELSTAWPEADLNIIENAGHAATEVNIAEALVRATKEMARKLL